jgi:hypothetical protein
VDFIIFSFFYKSKELFACWWSGGRSRSAVVWKMAPLCLMWCIWREHNARCFEDSSRSFEDLKHYFNTFYLLFILGQPVGLPQL